MKSCLCLLVLLLQNAVFAQGPAPAEAANMEKTSSNVEHINFSRDLEVPYLSVFYVEPVLTTDQEAVFKYYVTDWYQEEVRFQRNNHRFNVNLLITEQNSGKTYQASAKKVPAGNHELNAGKLPAGDYLMKLAAVDAQGRHSQTIFHQFRVRKKSDLLIPEKEIYYMQESDLDKYKINRKGDYGIFHYIDAAGKNEAETKALVEQAASKMSVPAGKYLVVIGGSKTMDDLFVENCGASGLQKPEWLPNHRSYASSKVLYAPDYNKEKVEAESVVTLNGLNALMKDVRAAGKRKLVFLPGCYRISYTGSLDIPSGLTVDLNGATVKLNQNAGHSGTMISMTHCVDSHVLNGTVEGDYFEHDYANAKNSSEWLHGIGIYGESKYSSFKDLTVRFITGYGVSCSFQEADFTGFTKMKNYIPGTIDRKTGKVIADKPGLYLSDMLPITKLKQKFGCLTVSRALGYQGLAMDARNVMYHFFDADQKYLETIDGEQYRRVYPPAKAEFMRVTVWSKQMPNPNDIIQSNLFKLPQNCAFENLLIQNARAVGMAPCAMYNMKIANCTLVRSGETLAKCAFDAEDGWDMMQDVWIYRNRFIGNLQNELLTCAGQNFVMEENQGNNLYLWSRTNNYVLRNNVFEVASLGYASRFRTGYCRLENNSFNVLSIGDSGDQYNTQKIMAQYEKESQGKGQVWNNERALTIFGETFDNVIIRCGKNSFLVNSTVSKSGSTPNLFQSTMQNMKIAHYAGTTETQSVIRNTELTIANAVKKITGVTFINTEIRLQSRIELEFDRCTFVNSMVSSGYWNQPVKIKFENCKVEEDQEVPLVKIGTYSIGDVSFKNSRFNMKKSSPVFLFDLRTHGANDQAGYVRFENCEIKTENGVVIHKPKQHSENTKPLKFELKSSIYSGEIISNPSKAWTVTDIPAESNKVIRGDIGSFGLLFSP